MLYSCTRHREFSGGTSLKIHILAYILQTTINTCISPKKHTYLDGNFQIRNVPERPIDNARDVAFSNVPRHGLHVEQGSVAVRHESVLRKVVGKDLSNAESQLLFLFGQIRTCSNKYVCVYIYLYISYRCVCKCVLRAHCKQAKNTMH